MSQGRCRCGAITVELSAEPKWVANCHCSDCRKATGCAFATYVGCHDTDVTITGSPVRYSSSPGVERLFCSTCGTPLAFRGDRWPGEIHLFVGVFDDPARFEPTVNVFTVDRLPWAGNSDQLPSHDRLGRNS